eukprot:COSAG06_NODE_36601_length_445_cov_0.708092_1_plen_74_part_01
MLSKPVTGGAAQVGYGVVALEADEAVSFPRIRPHPLRSHTLLRVSPRSLRLSGVGAGTGRGGDREEGWRKEGAW